MASKFLFSSMYNFQELEKSDSAAIRNGIVVLLTDVCVRYTALVDR